LQCKFRPIDDSLQSPEATTCKMVVVIFIILLAIIHFGNIGLDNNKNNEDKSWKDIMCLTL
jgi:hypothetical protein